MQRIKQTHSPDSHRYIQEDCRTELLHDIHIKCIQAHNNLFPKMVKPLILHLIIDEYMQPCEVSAAAVLAVSVRDSPFFINLLVQIDWVLGRTEY